MKKKFIILTVLSLSMVISAEAQILKKLKKKAEQAAERTILRKTDQIVTKKTEKTIDDATTKKNKTKKTSGNNSETQIDSESTNAALEVNTRYKTDFYLEDIVLKIHENGSLNQTQYFDANEIAVRIEPTENAEPGYLDSEGFIYAFNDKEGIYNKSALNAVGGQGMMVPNMVIDQFKLPPEPFLANTQKQMDKDVTPNPFNGFVEFAFVYKPEQFRYDDYKESKQSLGGKNYTKFELLNEPGYEGSYVIFDDRNRLIEIYSNKADTEQSMNAFDMSMMPPGKNLIVYEYKPVDVNLPPAKEVKVQGQDMMKNLMGSFKKNSTTTDIDVDDYDTSDSKGQVKSVRNAIKNHKVTADMLPESYDFDYIYKTTMVQNSKTSEAMEMNFLINTKNVNYNGAEYILNNKKAEGSSIMIFDLDLNAMVMLMHYGNQKLLQIHPIPEPNDSNIEIDYTITELPSKTILGYECMGLQLENNKYIIKAYHAKNAPIALSNFFGFQNNKASKGLKLPDMDPRLLDQFENSLVMEMQYEDKKRKKNNFIITAQALEKKATILKKSEYKPLNMFSAGNILKN